MHEESVRRCVERIDDARSAGTGAVTADLVALLSELHPVYAGLGANAAVRLRGYVLASFERTGLSDDAMPYVVETLESGQEPYLVAAAARALRGASRPESWMPPLLHRAAQRMRTGDDTFSLDEFGAVWPVRVPTTAAAELQQALDWATATDRAADRLITEGGASACCHLPAALVAKVHVAWKPTQRRTPCANTLFEDQSGRCVSATEVFTGKPSVAGFFYTRCSNPMKCSRTVTALGALQELVIGAGLVGRVRILAITYDPDYDIPERIRHYAEARGFAFDENNRALRARDGFESLIDGFGLQASFTGVTVSQHATELFVLDDCGRIAASFQRLQWQPGDVMTQMMAMLEA